MAVCINQQKFQKMTNLWPDYHWQILSRRLDIAYKQTQNIVGRQYTQG